MSDDGLAPGKRLSEIRQQLGLSQRRPIDFQQLLQRTDGRTDFVLLYGADGTMC
jgi:hypothetical protein